MTHRDGFPPTRPLARRIACTISMGLPSDFVGKRLLLRSGYVRGLASASYPHIHCGGGDFPCMAGGVCGERRLDRVRVIYVLILQRQSHYPLTDQLLQPCAR